MDVIKADSIEGSATLEDIRHISIVPDRTWGISGSSASTFAQGFRAGAALASFVLDSTFTSRTGYNFVILRQMHLLPLHQEPSADIVPQHIRTVNRMNLLCNA